MRPPQSITSTQLALVTNAAASEGLHLANREALANVGTHRTGIRGAKNILSNIYLKELIVRRRKTFDISIKISDSYYDEDVR